MKVFHRPLTHTCVEKILKTNYRTDNNMKSDLFTFAGTLNQGILRKHAAVFGCA